MLKALVVVAHPDDETIWMGGTILQNPSWDWTILSLCRGQDKDRAPKFKRVCNRYGATCMMTNLDDEHMRPLKTREIINSIKENVHTDSFDYIFTHGKNGEYGHRRHKEVHRAIKKMVSTGEFNCKKLLFFSYHPGKELTPGMPELRIPIPKGDQITKLKAKEYKKKIDLIQNTYGFTSESFERLSCHNEETSTCVRQT